MATVWVLAADKGDSIIGSPLVKAEAITGFRDLTDTVDVLGIHTGEPITVAANFSDRTKEFPRGFHLDLLRLIAEQTAEGLPDDHVVIVAERGPGRPWEWKAYKLDEYEYPER